MSIYLCETRYAEFLPFLAHSFTTDAYGSRDVRIHFGTESRQDIIGPSPDAPRLTPAARRYPQGNPLQACGCLGYTQLGGHLSVRQFPKERRFLVTPRVKCLSQVHLSLVRPPGTPLDQTRNPKQPSLGGDTHVPSADFMGERHIGHFAKQCDLRRCPSVPETRFPRIIGNPEFVAFFNDPLAVGSQPFASA